MREKLFRMTNFYSISSVFASLLCLLFLSSFQRANAGTPANDFGELMTTCTAEAGTFASSKICMNNDQAILRATAKGDAVIPAGFQVLYVLTSSEDLIIQDVSAAPLFTVDPNGLYTIHSLVYDTNTLDLGIVEIGVTTGFDVNGLLVQGGGDICAALDVVGIKFEFGMCNPDCFAEAGTLIPDSKACFKGGSAHLKAEMGAAPFVPEGFEKIYVLTAGDELIIEGVAEEPAFRVYETGLFTIHTLVYDPSTLDLGIVVPGETTGFDVNNLLIQGGGDICAALDVAGAAFNVEVCPCDADAGALFPINNPCIDIDHPGPVTLKANVVEAATVPNGFVRAYVLTSGSQLVIRDLNSSPSFSVSEEGTYTIHTLVYDPETLDIHDIEIGETTGFDVNHLLLQGGGSICAALDVEGAKFYIETCKCVADAGTLSPIGDPCLEKGEAQLTAAVNKKAVIPSKYEQLYVLTSGSNLVIQDVSTSPSFTVTEEGTYRIHSLVYNPTTLDLSIVVPGQTTGFDVNELLIQGGGAICASLDVEGAKFEIEECVCDADAGTLFAVGKSCIKKGQALLIAKTGREPIVPSGFRVIYVLTSGADLVIEDVSEHPRFYVEEEGRFTIHTLVFNPTTLDLGIVVFGQTTGFDVNALLVQGGGDICASLDVAGAPFDVAVCRDECIADAGELMPVGAPCISSGRAVLEARYKARKSPVIPQGYTNIYVLTSGTGLVIEAVNSRPVFEIDQPGLYTIHTLVYNPATLDLSIVVPGQTTGFQVNSLLIQGGGDICASLDVAGAPFQVSNCTGAPYQNMQVAPNPVQDEVKLSFNDAQKVKNIKVQLLSATGNVLLEREFEGGNQDHRLPLADLADGMYVIKVYYDGMEKRARKIMKQNQ